jgi:AcrR family transcriptional regulator
VNEASSGPSPAHERGKQRRRRAIVDAARDIISREGEAGMTMRSMAAQAGVSPATPYNLFGSKQAILQAVYDEDLEQFRTYYEQRRSGDALARLFDIMDVSITYFEREPEFYRALIGILQRNAGSEIGASAWALRLNYFRTLIEDNIAAAELRSDTPVELVSSALVRIFKAIAQEWVDGSLSLPQMRDELGTSFSLVLASLVTAKGEPVLDEVRRRYHRAG